MSTVIFINRFFYPDHSATSQLLSDIAFHLAGNDFDIKVIASRQLYDDTSVSLPRNEVVRSVSVTRIFTTRFGRNNLFGRASDYLSFYLSAFFVLMRTVKPGDCIVAKTDPPMISVIARIVTVIKSARLINWNQDLFPEVGTELGIAILEYTKPFLLYLRNNALLKADMNIVLGETMKDKLLSLGIKQSNIAVIPNWSDGREIYPVLKDVNPLVKEWDFENKFVIGYSGNMGRAHEFLTMLDIAESLQNDEDIVFVFIGGGAKRAWIEAQVKKRGLVNFYFKPYQPREKLALSLSVPDVHLISLLPNLEGLIVPSKYYGVAAAGKPCLFIGDNNGEISRILSSHDCGASIEIGDVAAGVEYLTSIKNDKKNYDNQCLHARELFDRKFDSLIAFKKWDALLNMVAR